MMTAQDWDLLPELCHVCAGTAVIAVLEDGGVPASVQALHAGAAGILPGNATLAAMREVLGAAVRGDSLVPTSVLRTLTEWQPSAEPATGTWRPSAAERHWLRHLARGESLAAVATRAAYPQRMFRLLRDLYTKIGTANRTEATIRARDENGSDTSRCSLSSCATGRHESDGTAELLTPAAVGLRCGYQRHEFLGAANQLQPHEMRP